MAAVITFTTVSPKLAHQLRLLCHITPLVFQVNYLEYATFNTAPYEVSSYETIRFPSRQANISLSGWYLEVNPNYPVVIVTHGMGDGKGDANVLIASGMLEHNGMPVPPDNAPTDMEGVLPIVPDGLLNETRTL